MAPPLSVVVVGGFDPGGGAGVLRDVATAWALGVHAHVVGTAWTEQGPGVHRIEPRAPEAVLEGVRQALAVARPSAVKIGMAVGPATAEAILLGLAGFTGPVVVDPVLATTAGGGLWSGSPADLMPLLRRARLATPNALEVGQLAGVLVSTPADAEAAARALVASEGVAAVLVKGGHMPPEGSVTDLLVAASETRRFDHRRVPGPSPRGTGCALATAIAIALGRGQALDVAVEAATTWLAGAIGRARWVGNERHLGS